MTTSPPELSSPQHDEICPIHQRPPDECRDLHAFGDRSGPRTVSTINLFAAAHMILTQAALALELLFICLLWVIAIAGGIEMLTGYGAVVDHLTIALGALHIPGGINALAVGGLAIMRFKRLTRRP
jgi:hypothetical protein